MNKISLQTMTYKLQTKVGTFYEPTLSKSHHIINVKIEREMRIQTLVKIKYLMKHEQQSHKQHPQEVHPPPPKHKYAQS